MTKSFRFLPLVAALAILSGLPSLLAACQQEEQQPSQQEYTVEQLVEMLDDKNPDRRIVAGATLSEFPDQYEKFAVPLSRLFLERDEILQDVAKRVFRLLGLKAVEQLDPDFESGGLDHLRRVCSAINTVGDPCEKYKADLVNLLASDRNYRRRVAAMYALTGFSNGCPEAIEHIVADLEHPDMNVTLFTCRLIIKTGPEARAAIPNLLKLLEKPNISQRGFAAWSLASIGQTDQFEILPILEKMLNKYHVMERERALIATGIVGPEARELAPQVRKLIQLKGSNLEGHAAVTLWKITGDTTEPVEALMDLAENSLEFEINGLVLLESMGPAASEAIDFLIERTRVQDDSVRVKALDVLGAIGPAASQHSDYIAGIAREDKDPLVRLAARTALRKINDEGDE